MTVLSTVFGLSLSVIIIAAGLTLNHRFWKKLRLEKKQTPLGRKGNVIEPVMSWFCILQSLFWPSQLLYLWINTNEIIPSDKLPPWLCHTLFTVLKFGRMCICYNSAFVAFIRYVHIVHHQTSNQWNYERTAKRFKFASIAIPIFMETVGAFTHSPALMAKNVEEVNKCLLDSSTSNITLSIESAKPFAIELTLQYLPSSAVNLISYVYIALSGLVCLNLAEVFLYLRIFHTMKWY